MIPFPILIGLSTLVLAGASEWVNAEEPGSGNAMKEAFGRLERGEITARPESYGAIIDSVAALQNFIARLPTKNAKQLYNDSVSFVTHYLGNFKALRNQAKFTDQYDRFKQAVLREGGLGTGAQQEAARGVALIEKISGKKVDPQDKQALRAVAKYQAAMILQGKA